MGIYFLERACTAQVRALSGEPNMPSQAALETTKEQSESLFKPGVENWLCRLCSGKLDRLDPSFRD